MTVALGIALRAAAEDPPAPAAPAKKPSSAIEIAAVTRPEPVDFGKDILPILRQNCIACHNDKDQDGDLVLESPEGIRKGGESGPAVVEGKGMESLLLQAAAKLEKPFMPPKNNKVGAKPLTPEELGLLKLWIDQGAKGEGGVASGPVEWHPLPAGLNPIYAVAVTDDGQLAACNRANQIFVYSLPKRQLLTRLTDPALLESVAKGHPGIAHRDLVQSLAFSPDGKLLASGGYRQVKLWQRPDPAVRFTLEKVATTRVGAVATTPDGKTIAAGSDDGVIRLFNAADGKPGLEMKGHAGEVTALRFSEEGDWLLSGSADRSVRLWKVADGTPAGRLDTPHPVSAVLALAADDGPPQLVTAGGDNLLRLWSMPAAPTSIEGEIPGPITATAATIDRKQVAVAGADKIVRLIDTSGKVTASLPAHSAAVRAIGFDSTGKILLTGGEDGSVTLAALDQPDAKPAPVLTDPAGKLTAAALRPDGKQIATASGEGRIVLWKLDAPAPRPLGKADEAAATAGIVSPNRQLLATAGMAGGKPAVLVRNIASGEIAQTLLGAEGAITSIAFSADSARVIAGSADKTARVWTLADSKEVGKFAGHAQPLTAVALHPDGAQAISAAADGAVKLWTIAEGVETKSLAGHTGAVVALTMLPSGQLATASADKTQKVFDLAAGTPVRSTDLAAAATAMSLSPDNAKLAVATDDKQVRLLNPADGAPIIAMTGPAAAANSLSFSADGKRLVSSGGAEGAAAVVWDVETGVALESLPGAGIVLAAFADKSDEVLIARADKTIAATALRFQFALAGFTKPVTELLYTNDGSIVIGASEDTSVRGFAAADGQQRYLANNASPVRDLALSPDGAWLATGGDDMLVKMWNAANGAAGPKPQFGPFTAPVTAVAFSADSKRVVAASGKADEVWVFDLQTGLLADSYAGHGQPATALVCLPRAEGVTLGDTIVSTTAEAANGARTFRTALVRQWQGHGAPATSLSLMPSTPRQFISGGPDGGIRLWNAAGAADPQVVREFAHGGPVTSVAVRADGKVIASAGATFAKLHRTENGEQIALLRGDRAATELAQLSQRRFAFAQFEVTFWTQQGAAATQRQAAETQAVTRSTQAKATADQVLPQKQTALTERTAAKDVADKALAAAVTEMETATTGQVAAEKLATESKTAADAAQAKYLELVEAAKKAAADAQAAVKVATDAKAKSDTLTADAAAKLKVATDAKTASDAAATASDAAAKVAADAKAAADADPGNAALQEAAATAAKAAADAAATAKTAAEALAVAQKASDEAAALAKTAGEEYAIAQKAADDATAVSVAANKAQEEGQKVTTDAAAVAQAAAQAKAAADQVLAAAKQKHATAEQAAKTEGTMFANAMKELELAQLNVTSSEQAIVAAQASLAKAEKDIADATAATAAAQAAVTAKQAELASAQKAAAEVEKPIGAVAFSPDGGTVVTAAEDGAVRTFSSESGLACDVLRGHAGAVSALAVSPDGSIVSGSADLSVKVWDMNQPWTLKQTIGTADEKSPLADRVLSLAFTPDGAILATGGGVPSRSGELKLWEVATGSLVREIPDAHSDTVYGLSFSGDGKLLASGAADKFVKVWNVADGTLARSFEGHTNHVLDVSFRHDGRVVVSGGADNQMKVWDVLTGEQRPVNPQPSKLEVTSVSYVGFTDRFLATTGDGTVSLRREDLGADRNFEIGGEQPFVYCGVATPDGTVVLAGGHDSILRVRASADGKVLADFSPPDAPPAPATEQAKK